MPKLNRIYLINTAGFDELEFPVGGHCQVIGVNGHGKSTVLRTVLFFYLGTNDKASYALHETKKDFVSHYLGYPPSYLIYEVARSEGQPSYHIAVTRPAGRIQFHFVDAPFRRDYYVDGKRVLPIERVHERWREDKCAFETIWSYDDFSQRIYGIIPSPYAVFRPAIRNSGQVSVLPRIISGIFTVSQLDADKLKLALTCGVRRDALATELDLVHLKNQLENFSRVNRAVKTYVRYEQEAIDLVEVAADFEEIKAERQRAIGDLVRAAKLLPEELHKLEEQHEALKQEEKTAVDEFELESSRLTKSFEELGRQIAVLSADIKRGEETQEQFEKREIERKSGELDSLALFEEEKRLADQEYASRTAKYADENQRKEQLLSNIHQSWARLVGHFQQRLGELERQFRQTSEQLESEKAEARIKIEDERSVVAETLVPRHARLDKEQSALNNDFKAFGETKPPLEIVDTGRKLKESDLKQNEESSRQKELRSEIALIKEKAHREREKLERDAKEERDGIEAAIQRLDADRGRVEGELEAFDGSLARFFQTSIPETWPEAAKTLNRETLFRNAAELDAKISSKASHAVWGAELSTKKLPGSEETYDRAKLNNNLREIRKTLIEEREQHQAAQTRFLSEFDALEKRSAQAVNGLQVKIEASVELRSKLLDEGVRLENALLTLQSQFEDSRRRRRDGLEKREVAWKDADALLRKEEGGMKERFDARIGEIEADFKARKLALTKEENEQRASINGEEVQSSKKHQEELARIEREFQKALSEKGADSALVATAKKRVSEAEQKLHRISAYRDEVAEYRQKKRDWMDPLSSWRSRRKSAEESSKDKGTSLRQLSERHQAATKRFSQERVKLDAAGEALKKDQQALARFQRDSRFLQEWGYFERDDLPSASFYRAEAVCDFLSRAENAHQRRDDIGKDGDKKAKNFLRHFDSETLDRKVLGFSPIHEYFDWFIFVGSELKPFVNNRGIAAMKRIQTLEFEQLIRNICNKNADFQEGIRQVNQTANLVQSHLAANNFVDVLDSIELKVQRVDNHLTRTLAGLEDFAGVSFGVEQDLFGKRADRGEIDRAIDCFDRLVREIDSYKGKQLFLTDYFDFLIRVHENGHDMGWRKSLDDIGSTGTDYLVKMLVYLSLIEVYRERAIDSKAGSTVHCVLDETGILAPKYLRKVLEYAASRGILLITAGHSQQTAGFDNWVLVRKIGQRFTGQTVLRKVLRCD